MKIREVARRLDRMGMMKPGKDGIAIVDFTSYHRAMRGRHYALGWCDASPTPVKIVQSLRRRDFKLGLPNGGRHKKAKRDPLPGTDLSS
jgi:hypothetical protein